MSKKSKGEMLNADRYEILFAEEELILHAQVLIQRVLNERKMTQKQLADKLDVGESYISQMLGCSARNLTLRTVARVLKVLDAKAIITLDDCSANESISDECVSAETTNAGVKKMSLALGSDAWGEIVDMAPRKRAGRRKDRQAAAYAAYDPPHHEMAMAA